jgi:hypothetical protein
VEIKELGHLVLHVRDLARSVGFHRDVLRAASLAAVSVLALGGLGCAPVGTQWGAANAPTAATPTLVDSIPVPWIGAVTRGDRVRWRAGRRWGTGTVIRVGADTLALSAADRQVMVPAGRIEALSVSRGRRVSATRAIGGALGGTIAGGLAGVVIATVGQDCGDWCGVGQFVVAMVGAGVGFLIGTVVGLVPAEQWERVHPPYDPTLYQWAPVERPHGQERYR